MFSAYVAGLREMSESLSQLIRNVLILNSLEMSESHAFIDRMMYLKRLPEGHICSSLEG